MAILLIVTFVWILLILLVAVLCIAARRGDGETAAVDAVPQPQPGARRRASTREPVAA